MSSNRVTKTVSDERLQPTLEEYPGDGAVTLINSTLNNMHIIN